MEEVFNGAGNALSQVLEELMDRFVYVVQTINSEADLKVLPVDIIVNASSNLVSIALRGVLIAKGYKDKRGFTVSNSIRNKYMHFYNKTKQLLRQRFSEALMNHEIGDLQKLLESINSTKKRAAEVKNSKQHSISS